MTQDIAPETRLATDFSAPDATPTAWEEGRRALDEAELYWLTSVRPDGRPHVTPLIGVWLDDALHFCTGPGERKAKNLAYSPLVAMTTGCNAWDEGLDLVVEGAATRVTDEATLQRLADAWVAKYGEGWRFTVAGDAFQHEGGDAHVFRVAPVTAFGFRKGHFSQTRWRF